MSGAFSSAFLSGDPRTPAFLPASYRDPEARHARVLHAARRPLAPALLALLREQNQALAPSPARERHLELLGRPGTAVVVTGQQVGLFLGPLYTFHKAASAIALARALERESGVPTVPLFWLQTEDHDFAEINHCHVLVPGAPPLRLAVGEAAADPQERVSVAHRRLGEDVAAQLDALATALDGLPHTAEFLALLAAHYRPGRPLAAAFAGLLGALFADEGLVFFEPRGPIAARLAAPVYRRALVEHPAIAQALGERSAALAAAGFAEQVHVRPNSPLVFYHLGEAAGPRYRLERQGDAWALAGAPGRPGTPATLDDSELIALLETDPLRFSTSALLRPIVQDTLLPTACYVGGPGEINYFAQLGPLYAHFGLAPPLVAPRARFRLLDERIRSLLGEMGLAPGDLERPREELERRLADAHAALHPGALPGDYPTPAALEAELLEPFGRSLDRLAALPELPPQIHDALRRTRGTVARATSRLAERYRRHLAERDRTTQERLARLTNFLHPEGTPQERYYSLAYFACRHGARRVKEAILAALDPYAPAVKDVVL